MKILKIIAAAAVSAIVLGSGFTVNAHGDHEGGHHEYEYHDGYYFDYAASETTFNSYDDYLKSSKYIEELCKGGYMGRYYENYDYIYVPEHLKDNTDCITSITVTANKCRITYDIDSKSLETCHYFYSDGQSSCDECHSAFKTGIKKTSFGNEYYGTFGRNRHETVYYCRYDGSYFSFDSELGINNMGETPFVKLYNDSILREEDGCLYYGDKKESGWKTVCGHRYYFRKNGSAVQNSVYNIDGCMYKFNANGICTGKYTGYLKRSDGSRIYYNDGVPSGKE